MKGKVTERQYETEIGSLNECNIQIWERLKLTVNNSTMGSHISGRGPSIWAIFHCLSNKMERERENEGKLKSGLTVINIEGIWRINKWMKYLISQSFSITVTFMEDK